MKRTTWTPERCALLRKLWEQDLSASQIADVMGGISRSAVLGQTYRLGLRREDSPYRRKTQRPIRPADWADAHPLARRLFDTCAEARVPIPTLAEMSGVPCNTIYLWQMRNLPRIDNLQATLNVVGLELAIVPIGSELHGIRGGTHEDAPPARYPDGHEYSEAAE